MIGGVRGVVSVYGHHNLLLHSRLSDRVLQPPQVLVGSEINEA